MRKEILRDDVFLIDDFLSKDECDRYIELAENIGFDEAKLGFSEGARLFKMTRNNDRIEFVDVALAQSLFERAQPLLPGEIDGVRLHGLNSRFRYYRYTSGQRFKRHKDGRQKSDEAGVESRLSFLLYLNDDFEGGETKFSDISIKPKRGTALIFIHETWHEGCVLDSGSKYVLRSDVMYSS